MASIIGNAVDFIRNNRKTIASVAMGAGAVVLSFTLPGAPLFAASAFFASKITAFVGAAYVSGVSMLLAVTALFASVALCAGLMFKMMGSFLGCFMSKKTSAPVEAVPTSVVVAKAKVDEENVEKTITLLTEPVVHRSPLNSPTNIDPNDIEVVMNKEETLSVAA